MTNRRGGWEKAKQEPGSGMIYRTAKRSSSRLLVLAWGGGKLKG